MVPSLVFTRVQDKYYNFKLTLITEKYLISYYLITTHFCFIFWSGWELGFTIAIKYQKLLLFIIYKYFKLKINVLWNS